MSKSSGATMHRIDFAAAAVLMAGWVASAQSPAPLSFDVASVRPAAPCCAAGQWRESTAKNDRIDFRYVTLRYCIAFAYGVKEYQVAGPSWIGEGRFDIVAKGPEGTKTADLPGMVKRLLTDRFKLQLHPDSREYNVYVLAVNPKGPKLTESPEDPNAPPGAAYVMGHDPKTNLGTLQAKRASMTSLANTLPRLVGRPVVDQTGLTGRYDFDLEP